MKQFYLLPLFIFCLSLNLAAQKGKNSNTEEEKTTEESIESDELKVYNLALKYGDFTVAKTAVYEMLAEDPSRTDLLDTLTVIYFIQGSYGQAIAVGNEILETNPNKLAIREIVAVSYKNVNAPKEALTEFETLFKESGDLYFLYEVASMQYALKRFGECIASCDAILNAEGAAEMKVNIGLGQGQYQDVPLPAAVLNMKGFIALEVNQPEAAKENFEAALAIDPEFVLPKANLQKMAKMEAENGEGDSGDE
jgi:tetratricopeptide (TPR) repeat protein